MSVFIIDHVFKSFYAGKKEIPVLKDIDICLPDYGLVSIVGKSGSGKSTLLNILMGIEKPTKGQVIFQGESISKYNDKKFSEYHLYGVSLIFQHYNLFNDFTALENVVFPLLMKGENRKTCIEEAKKLFEKMNVSYLINRKVAKLSGGEKQRVAIIRAMITHPSVILCDEPTGALDSQNSREIMDILKEISSRILVVMVSHNKKLVDEYSDQILALQDGQIVSNVSFLKRRLSTKYEKVKYKYSGKWNKKFILSNLKKDFRKNLFSIIACAFSFSTIFISFGFSNGSKSSQEEALKSNLSIGFATASETEFYKIKDSPLTYQKVVRPTIQLIDEKLSNLSTVRCEEDISYLISKFSNCNFDNKKILNYEMIPLYDESLESYGKDLLFDGNTIINGEEEILINEEFAKLLGEQNPINKELKITCETQLKYSTGNYENPFVYDDFYYEKTFKIVGIIKEFPFLNTPKIFYSYFDAKNFLKNKRMENLSNYLVKNYSYLDYLINCSADDPASSYSQFLFLDNLSEVDEFFSIVSKLKETDDVLQISSTAFEIKSTYGTFIDSFSSTLLVFVAIAFLGINFILGMISLSTFVENKKTTAVLTCLGSRNKSIYDLYLSENYLIIIVSFVISIFLSSGLSYLLNKIILKRFALKSLIRIPFLSYFGIRFGLILFLGLIAFIFSTIFTMTPMLIYRHFSLADELRDE